MIIHTIARRIPAVPSWFRIVPGTDPASVAANRSNWEALVMLVVLSPLLFSLLTVGAMGAGSSAADSSTPLPSSSSCTSDTDCAARDTRVAQDGYGVAVWANTPHVTPHVDEARHGTSILLSCDDGRVMVDTPDGVACLMPGEHPA